MDAVSSREGSSAEVSPRLSPERGEGASDVKWGVRAVRTAVQRREGADESEDLKGRWGTPHPPRALHTRSGVLLWNAEGVCWHIVASGLGSSGSGCPRGFPGTPSVCLIGSSSSHPGGDGGRGTRFSFLFFLLLLKRGPFTSTWKTEGLLGMCQAKQKHMVWIYSPKTEQEKGGNGAASHKSSFVQGTGF